MDLVILVPVLDRPHRVEPFVASVREATPDARLLFICDPLDTAQILAVDAAKEERIAVTGNYATKIRAGIGVTTESLIFTGADDLDFRPGWFEIAKSWIGDGIEVVGVNDLIKRDREHATHFLMTRDYAEKGTIDGDPGPFHPGYHHWFCDDELIATAKHRGAYKYVPEAVVEHLHPFARKAPYDRVYAHGAMRNHSDRNIFQHRSRLWT